ACASSSTSIPPRVSSSRRGSSVAREMNSHRPKWPPEPQPLESISKVSASSPLHFSDSTGAIKNYVPQAFHGSNDQASQRTPIAGRNPDKAGMCGKAECCRSVDSGEEGETE